MLGVAQGSERANRIWCGGGTEWGGAEHSRGTSNSPALEEGDHG